MPSEDHFEFLSLERQLVLAQPSPLKPDADCKEQDAFKARSRDGDEAAKLLERLDGEYRTASYKKGASCCRKCMKVEQLFGAQPA